MWNISWKCSWPFWGSLASTVRKMQLNKRKHRTATVSGTINSVKCHMKLEELHKKGLYRLKDQMCAFSPLIQPNLSHFHQYAKHTSLFSRQAIKQRHKWHRQSRKPSQWRQKSAAGSVNEREDNNWALAAIFLSTALSIPVFRQQVISVMAIIVTV